MKDVTPLLTHWSYVFLALTHWSHDCNVLIASKHQTMKNHDYTVTMVSRELILCCSHYWNYVWGRLAIHHCYWWHSSFHGDNVFCIFKMTAFLCSEKETFPWLPSPHRWALVSLLHYTCSGSQLCFIFITVMSHEHLNEHYSSYSPVYSKVCSS